MKNLNNYSTCSKRTKGSTMKQRIKTTTRATKPCDRDLMKSVTYLLRLNRISLISSLKSVINTAITEMDRFRKSIMDSFDIGILPHTQPNSQKKAQPQKETEHIQYQRLIKPFYYHLVKMDNKLYHKGVHNAIFNNLTDCKEPSF